MAIRRRPVLVDFVDQFGEKQVIHRTHGRLGIRRKSDTVCLTMTKVVGRVVGERIREERLKAGLSMEQLALRAGLTGGKQGIYQIEQAMNTGIRLGTLYALAAALGVSPFSLLPPVSMVLEQAGATMRQEEKLAV